MAQYRCYLIDKSGRFRFGEIIEGQTVDAAVERARQLLFARPHYATVELWLRDTRIHAETRRAEAGLIANSPFPEG